MNCDNNWRRQLEFDLPRLICCLVGLNLKNVLAQWIQIRQLKQASKFNLSANTNAAWRLRKQIELNFCGLNSIKFSLSRFGLILFALALISFFFSLEGIWTDTEVQICAYFFSFKKLANLLFSSSIKLNFLLI